MFEASIPLDFIDMPIRAHQEYGGLFLSVALFSPSSGNWIAGIAFSLFA
jgi:hypothetical protein